MFFLKELPTQEILESYAAKYPQMDVPCVASALAMLRSASVLLRRLEGYFTEHGLSQTRFLVLILIDREPERDGLTATELAQRMDISKPVVSNTLKSLVDEGFINPRPNAGDARSRIYRMTLKGAELLESLLPGYYDILQDHMQCGDPNGGSL